MTNDLTTRSAADLTAGIQNREFPAALTVRTEAESDAMTVAGIGVPYDQETELYEGLFESIAPGAVQPRDHRLLYWRHADPIGRVISESNDPDAWRHESRISDTPTGREAYTLARDGVIQSFSIGFYPVEWVETRDEAGVHIRHTKIDVREVSLVPIPAYDGAAVTDVRALPEGAPTPKENNMPVENDALVEVREDLTELKRSVALLSTPAAPAGPLTRSFGDLVKKIAAGDEPVTRAYEGAVSTDTVMQDAWIGSLVEITKQKQTVASTFARGAVPATGLNVEYAVLASDTISVNEQAAEGDDLAFGKLSVTTQTAPIKTLGGYSSLSRQAIERSNTNILDTTFQALYEKASRAVESLARAALNAGIASAASITGDLTTQNGIIAAILDLFEEFDDNGLSLDGIFVDKATFLSIYGVAASDRVLQVSGAPTDRVGSITVKTASGDVAGVPFRVLPGAAANTVVAYDSTAIKTLESSMPRLQADNVVNLTRDFSVYTYAASFVQRPSGLVTVVSA